MGNYKIKAMSVKARHIERFQVQVTAGKAFSFIADESSEMDGDSLGPNPFMLLLGSLATCKVVTLFGVAHEHNIPLEGADVTVTHWQNELCRGPNDPKQRGVQITAADCDITLRGKLSEAQQEVLRQGVNCPVAKTLVEGIRVSDKITFELA